MNWIAGVVAAFGILCLMFLVMAWMDHRLRMEQERNRRDLRAE